MRSLVISLIAVIFTVTLALSAPVKKYGKPITLQETTRISDIYANPDQYNGQRVKVRGPVVDVCSMRGCWIAIGSDQEFQSILFKVDDGVMVFPMDAKGLTAIVEGVLAVTTLSEEEQIAQGEHLAQERNAHFDPAAVKGPKVSITIMGEGAEIF